MMLLGTNAIFANLSELVDQVELDVALESQPIEGRESTGPWSGGGLASGIETRQETTEELVLRSDYTVRQEFLLMGCIRTATSASLSPSRTHGLDMRPWMWIAKYFYLGRTGSIAGRG